MFCYYDQSQVVESRGFDAHRNGLPVREIFYPMPMRLKSPMIRWPKQRADTFHFLLYVCFFCLLNLPSVLRVWGKIMNTIKFVSKSASKLWYRFQIQCLSTCFKLVFWLSWFFVEIFSHNIYVWVSFSSSPRILILRGLSRACRHARAHVCLPFRPLSTLFVCVCVIFIWLLLFGTLLRKYWFSVRPSTFLIELGVRESVSLDLEVPENDIGILTNLFTDLRNQF